MSRKVTAPEPLRCIEPGCDFATHCAGFMVPPGRCRRHHAEHMQKLRDMPFDARVRYERREEARNGNRIRG